MKMPTATQIPKSYRPEDAAYSRRFLAVCLIFAGLTLAATSASALRHPPLVGFVADQRIKQGNFATQYFRIINFDKPDGVTISTMVQSTNDTFYPYTYVAVSACGQADFGNGCADDGTGYRAVFTQPDDPNADDVTTIIIRANENGMGGKVGQTSFTLRQDPNGGNNPPMIQNLPNRAVQIGVNSRATYETNFVVGDLDESNMEDVCADELCTMSTLTLSGSSNIPNLFESIAVTLNPPDVDLDIAAKEIPRSYKLKAITIANPSPTVASVRVDVTDSNGNVTSTSALMKIVAASNSTPSISNPTSENFEEQQLPTETSVTHPFTVADANLSADLSQLKVSAFSSNTKIVPNDFVKNIKVTQPTSTGGGSVEIIPALPAPSPSPGGVPQASTITLTVADDSYFRQTTFLYVLAPPTGSPTISFSRPSGVYPTTQPENLGGDSFLTGSMYNLQWDKVEMTEGGDYDFLTTIEPIIDDGLPLGKDLSLGLQKEPCYIAEDALGELEFNTWCDTKMGNQPKNCPPPGPTPCIGSGGRAGFQRAVPWDPHLRERRNLFLQALAADLDHLRDNGQKYIDSISIINPNLPGADDGIREVSVNFDGDCLTHPDNCMDGYTRERLLWAIQDELRTVQDAFPGKLVQIGFFEPTDFLDASHNGSPLWKWLYRDATTDANALDENGVHMVALFDEFNGIKRPRVSFFQENLAATRTSDMLANPAIPRSNAPNYIAPPNTTAYTITPISSFIPSFAFYNGALTTETYNNGILFESNTIWSNPFKEDNGRKLINTINGSPNDGLEGAFNAYLSQYLEVYVADINQAMPLSGDPTLNAVLWAGQLQSWHDYTAHLRSDVTPLEAPAGLTVTRNSSTNNVVSWYAVYGANSAISYTVEKIDFGVASPTWVAAGCSPTSNTICTDNALTGSQYGYRVRAKRADGSNPTPYASVAVFLSEGTGTTTNYDGYIENTGGSKTVYNNAAEPGIRAGQGSNSDMKGFLSFNTTPLGSATTILGAKLRLKQTTNNDGFDAFGACTVDIRKGNFSNNPALQMGDFTANASATNVAQIIGVGGSTWVETDLSPVGAKSYVNNIDRTQFRLNFNHINGISNKYAGWNSGGSIGNEPQLIVQFQ